MEITLRIFIGFVAAALTTMSFFPQVVKSWRLKETKDISLPMYVLIVVGISLWLVYGILIKDLPIILANVVSLILTSSILFLKIRYG